MFNLFDVPKSIASDFPFLKFVIRVLIYKKFNLSVRQLENPTIACRNDKSLLCEPGFSIPSLCTWSHFTLHYVHAQDIENQKCLPRKSEESFVVLES